MEEEEVLNMIDSYWFGGEIFKKSSKKVAISSSTPSEESPADEEKVGGNRSSSKTELSSHLMLMETRSKSEQQQTMMRMMSSGTSSNDVLISGSLSPDSVIPVIKETAEKKRKKKKKTKKGLSKSLSELEFEEVKGFMDLGFVFSEEDKDSSLVEIIPGLQRRLGKEFRSQHQEQEQEQSEEQKITVARPYLSEAWEVLDMRKTKKMNKNSLINWRVPNPSNEIDMKDSLKWWAHTVASTVR